MKILASDQVSRWLQSLAPEPKRQARADLKLLSNGKGDVKTLQRDLSGFYRLRSGEYRIIFKYRPGKNGPECYCIYAESRDVVYTVFSALLATGEI